MTVHDTVGYGVTGYAHEWRETVLALLPVTYELGITTFKKLHANRCCDV